MACAARGSSAAAAAPRGPASRARAAPRRASATTARSIAAGLCPPSPSNDRWSCHGTAVAALRIQGRPTWATSLTGVHSPISWQARPLRRPALGCAHRAETHDRPVDRTTWRLSTREVPDGYRIARGERVPQRLIKKLVEMVLCRAPLRARDAHEHQQQGFGLRDLFRVIPVELAGTLLLFEPHELLCRRARNMRHDELRDARRCPPVMGNARVPAPACGMAEHRPMAHLRHRGVRRLGHGTLHTRIAD